MELCNINQKSVDFVLCSKATLAPVYAIELDDYTHGLPERVVRDVEVERIFREAKFPLVRFTNGKNVTADMIIDKLQKAHSLYPAI